MRHRMTLYQKGLQKHNRSKLKLLLLLVDLGALTLTFRIHEVLQLQGHTVPHCKALICKVVAALLTSIRNAQKNWNLLHKQGFVDSKFGITVCYENVTGLNCSSHLFFFYILRLVLDQNKPIVSITSEILQESLTHPYPPFF